MAGLRAALTCLITIVVGDATNIYPACIENGCLKCPSDPNTGH